MHLPGVGGGDAAAHTAKAFLDAIVTVGSPILSVWLRVLVSDHRSRSRGVPRERKRVAFWTPGFGVGDVWDSSRCDLTLGQSRVGANQQERRLCLDVDYSKFSRGDEVWMLGEFLGDMS